MFWLLLKWVWRRHARRATTLYSVGPALATGPPLFTYRPIHYRPINTYPQCPWQWSRWDIGLYWMSNCRRRPMNVRANREKQCVVLTKRKISHHCIIIASIVHHEIFKFWSKTPVINHFQNCRSEVRTIVLAIDVLQGQDMVFQLTVFRHIVSDYA
jgi:hypothetical protein